MVEWTALIAIATISVCRCVCLVKLFTQFVVLSGFINSVHSHVKAEAD